MYLKGLNGERKEVSFGMNSNNTSTEQSAGSNKAMLYLALLIGLIVVVGSGVLIYRHYHSKNVKSNFGYKL